MKSDARIDKLLPILLITGILAIYWNVSGFDFINLDDGKYVFENPHIVNGLTLDNIKWAFKFPNDVYWHPLAWLSHMLDCDIFGVDPGGAHIVNVGLHLVNSLLLLTFLIKFTGSKYRSYFVAALFAFHPLNVESVAWVAERKNLLSTMFFFMTILTYSLNIKRKSKLLYGSSILLFVLGLMVKPMLVILPIILILLDYWPLQRFVKSGDAKARSIDASRNDNRVSPYALWVDKIPFIIISIFFCILTIISSRHGLYSVSFDAVPFSTRILNSVIWYMGYIGKILYPFNLTIYEAYPKMVVSYWASAAVALWLIAISFIVFRLREKYPFLFTGWFWYLCALIPVIGLLQQGLWAAMADRFAYIPQIGIFFMITWGGAALFNKFRQAAISQKVAALAILFVLLFTTWVQVQYWENSVTLFKRSIDITPNSAALHTIMGYSLARIDEPEASKSHYLKALEIDPTYPYANHYLGYLASKEGRLEEALRYLKIATEYSHNDHSYYVLGVVLIKLNRPIEAVHNFRECLRINPEYPKASDGLAIASSMVSAAKQETAK